MFKFQPVAYGCGKWNGNLILDNCGKEENVGGLCLEENIISIRTRVDLSVKQIMLLIMQLSDSGYDVMNKKLEIVEIKEAI